MSRGARLASLLGNTDRKSQLKGQEDHAERGSSGAKSGTGMAVKAFENLMHQTKNDSVLPFMQQLAQKGNSEQLAQSKLLKTDDQKLGEFQQAVTKHVAEVARLQQ